MTDSLYLGKTQREWASLASEAEDIMLDVNIGQHIVGLYPCGLRTYGVEAPCELLCIYIDEPNSMLDPFRHVSEIFTKVETFEGQVIVFAELYQWVRWIGEFKKEVQAGLRSFYHIIPSLSEPQYEDRQLSSLLVYAGDLAEGMDWDVPVISSEVSWEEACYLRARLVLAKDDIFAPCINKNWDRVHNLALPEEAKELDNRLVELVTTNGESVMSSRDLGKLCAQYQIALSSEYNPMPVKTQKEKLGEETKKFFLCLL